MLSYCLNCRKNAEKKNPSFLQTKKRKIDVSSNCVVCVSKKSKLIKEQEVSGIIGSLAIT